MHAIDEPAAEADAQPAYLFVCRHTDTYGITLDKTGANLPSQDGDTDWELQAEFPLGVQEALPAPMNPEPVIRGIAANGYFVWSEGVVRNPFGTSQ